MRKRISDAVVTAWMHALAWLRREAYVKALVEVVAKQAYLDGHNAAMENHYQVLANARACAQAYGELIGRQTLALELEIAHGVGEGGERAMSADEVGTLLRRQLH